MIETNLFGIKRKKVKRYKKVKRNLIPNFKLSDLDMIEIDSDTAIRFISTHHYAKSCTRAIGIAFGFYFDSELVGCIVYATPTGSNVVQSISDSIEFYQVYELTRLFMFDFLPNNVESYCISKTIKYIKNNYTDIKYLISYADSSFGHVGCIYQATNWIYTGTTERKVMFEYKGRKYHSKTMYDRYGTSSIPKLQEIVGSELKHSYSEFKYRYIYIISQSKKEYNELFYELKYDILDYPKLDISYYRLE